jgi:hypothetical protein
MLVPDIRLTETISISERDITDEEKRLASKYNSLVDECLDWALLEMRFGTHSSRIALASRVITSAARLAGMEVKTQTETHRVAFQQLLQEMTAVDVLEVTPALESAVDQDEDT